MSALTAIALAVLMHVAWNLLTRHAAPAAHFLWWAVGAHLVLFGAWTIPRIIPPMLADPVLALAVLVTGMANGVYFIALRHAYRFAPAGAVYPLARSAPLLVAVGETLLFGRTLPVEAWFGVALSVTGLWLIAFDTCGHALGVRRALPFAALAALMTGVYSLSDKLASARLDRIEDAIGFVSATFCLAWIVLTLELRSREGRWRPAARPRMALMAAGGLTVGLAYALVIHSMRALPAAYAVTLANGGVVLIVILGMLWLNEREGWRRRLAGAGASAVGMAIVTLIAHKTG
jgi:phosphonate utilization associated putative membrane protein